MTVTIDERIQAYEKTWAGVGLFGTDYATLFAQHRSHCTKNFPAMLAALRGALMDVLVINGNQKRQGFHPYALLQKTLEKTIAAAENVEGVE